MKTKPFEPILVRTLDLVAEQTARVWDKAKADLNSLLDDYKATGLPALTNDELPRLFADTSALMYDKITGGGHTHLQMEEGSKMKVDKAAALAILQKPGGYKELLESVQHYNSTGHKFYSEGQRNCGFAVKDIPKYFVIDDAGNLQYSTETVNILEAAGTCYIKTEKGADFYQFTQDIAASFFANNIDKHLNYKGPKMSLDVLYDKLDHVMKELDYTTKQAVPLFTNEGKAYGGDTVV